MTTLQLFLLIVSAAVFYMFFKQLFSGAHPKRGIDFEEKISKNLIGGISRPEKLFRTAPKPPDRISDLMQIADNAVEKGDFSEAKKALQSILYIDENHKETLQKCAYVYAKLGDYEHAKEMYERVLKIDGNNDTAHAALANALHRLNDDNLAIIHHKKSIELDSSYAPHYYNYANTLYDMNTPEEALINYKKAIELDDTLTQAQDMIKKIEG